MIDGQDDELSSMHERLAIHGQDWLEVHEHREVDTYIETVVKYYGRILWKESEDD